MATIGCFVAAPITAFRAPRAREYLETLSLPPPATVYGMLLSAVGETNRLVHQGAELAVAVISPGTRTRVLRTLWRVKDAGSSLGVGENKRPDFQELLVDVRLAVHVRSGSDEGDRSLAARLEEALRAPALVTRFGGLSLGESTHLVDELRPLRAEDGSAAATWLIADADGPYSLPIWPDHVGSRRTRHGQFSLRPATELSSPPSEAWTAVRPLGGD